MSGWPRNLKARCLGAVMLSVGATPAQADEALRLAGSTGAIGTMRQLAQAFATHHPGAEVRTIDDLNSGGAIRAVISGAVDVAASSRPLREDELAQGLSAMPYGRSPHIFAVASSAGVAGLTRVQVADLYSGRQQHWPDGTRIRLVLTPADDPDTVLLKGLSSSMAAAVDAALARQGMVADASDGVRADWIERTPGAIGVSILALVLSEHRALKALPLDGVAPSAKSIADGSYPLYKTFYLVTRTQRTPMTDAFVTHLRSPEGKAILERNGHWVMEAGEWPR